MESMFSAVLRIGLILTLMSIVHLLSLIFKKETRFVIKLTAFIFIFLILLVGIVFFVVLIPK